MSETIYLHGNTVTAEEYRAVRAKDKSLPMLIGKAGKPLTQTTASERRIHKVFVHSLLAQKNLAEARKWLENGSKAVRSLARFERVRLAGKKQKVALVAAMRKLAVLMNRLLKAPKFQLAK